VLEQLSSVDLGTLIRSERQRRGWTLRTLAKALNVSHGAVAQWESGTSTPGFARLVDICSVFGLSLETFLGPGSPYAGQIVQDAEELALLTAYRQLSRDERDVVLRMLVRAARPGPLEGQDPQEARKHD
jgi:transcriptional regulator with XRE-family HTH domain